MEEERVISRYWPASPGLATDTADVGATRPLAEATLRRTILDLGALRASSVLGPGASAKVAEAIQVLREAAEAQRER